jgi:hypothetical protein
MPNQNQQNNADLELTAIKNLLVSLIPMFHCANINNKTATIHIARIDILKKSI